METYGSEEHGYSDYEEEEEQEDPEEEDPEEEEADEVRSRTSSAPKSSESARLRSGKHGPRARSVKEEPSSKTRPPTSEAGSAGGREKEKDKKRPRGNLPQAPAFTGDRRADPKCFKKYVNKVDSYVELARKIIDDGEIGLRLHAALDGDAADYLEDVPANTFGGQDGWRILLRVLRDKFDETRQHKIGSAMKGFFKLQVGNCSLREAADQLDRAHRQCRDSGLTIPDSIMIHFYFEHTGMGQDKQANLLLRTNGEYDWKKIKQAVDLLYPNVMVRSGRDYTSYKGHGKRSAHEAHTEWAEQTDGNSGSSPLAWDASDEQVESWIYEHDPVEMLADVELYEGIPEDISRELHTCFTTHRENRQKLAKAVQARGFFVASKGQGKKGFKSAGKGKSSSSKGSGGKSKGKGKARNGMSLAELKAVTTCADCEQVGHWKGDPECPHSKRKTNEASREDEHYDDEEYHWDDQYWSPSFDGQERNAYQARRNKVPPSAAPYVPKRTSPLSRPAPSRGPMEEEVHEVTRTVHSLRQKATAAKSKPVDPGDVRRAIKKEIESDDFVAGVQTVKDLIEAKKENLISSSDAPSSVAEAVRHYQPMTYENVGSAWALIREHDKGPDVESLRDKTRRSFMVRKVHWDDDFEPELIPDVVMCRQVDAATRKTPTIIEGRSYITIDTACENTVCGMEILKAITRRFYAEFNIVPKVETEDERYCFGPGGPIRSNTRVSLPIAMQGIPMVIKTSALEKTNVPFLAGQDWLTFGQAIIDVGKGILQLPKAGVITPLLVDKTGHLVVGIDEFPDGGWPQGLLAVEASYEGAIFQAGDSADFSAQREIYTAASLGSVAESLKLSPNFHYEPNHDNFNQNLPRGPCVVPSDIWEFKYDIGCFIRHHRRPRSKLFTPEEDPSGPQAAQLSSTRLTVMHGCSDILVDDWSLAGSSEYPHRWVGITVFFSEGTEPTLTDFRPVHDPRAEVRFPDGSCHSVSVDSLRSLEGHKKIQQFDLLASTPMFERPGSKRKDTFHIPQQQFGSPIVSERQAIRASQRAHGPGGRTTGMASVGHGHAQDVGASGALAEPGVSSQGVHSSSTGADGLHHGDAAGDGGAEFFDVYEGFGDSSEDGKVSDSHPRLPASSGSGQAHRERAREVHGVRGVRLGEEGPDAGLRGAHQRRSSPGVRSTPRLPPISRRQAQQVQADSKGGGVLWQLGRVLLTLILAGAGGLYHRGGDTEEEAAGSQSCPTSSDGYALEPWLQETLRGATAANLGIGVGGRHGGRGGGMVIGDHIHDLSTGVQRRLKHNARRALALSRVSRGAVRTHIASASWPRRHFKYDVLEVFGGTSMVSLRAGRNWGLRVLQPVDIRYGVDLRRRDCRRWLLKMLGVWNPRLVLVEYPCTPWSILQRNVNYRDEPETLRALQEADRPCLKLCRDIFDSQVRRGAHAICENPASADSHREPEIMSLREAHFETTSCLCQFGMTGKQGLPMLKRVRFIATHEIFIRHLDRQCDFTHQHELVEGRNTSASAAYPAGLADAICRALIEVKETEDYGTKHVWDEYQPRKAHFVDVIREEDKWLPIFELVQEQLARKVQSSVFVDPHTELYRKVQELVPWQIANVQVAHLPKAKRVRPGLEKCHRASILQLNDDQITIETEYLPDAQAPRERFVTPVRHAIFVLGYAPGEPQAPSPAAPQPVQPFREHSEEIVGDLYSEALQHEGLVRQDFAGECWFVGPPLTAQQKKLAPSLVRMHRNLGHPRNPDFTRALAQQDRLDPEVLALSRRLRCATCERTRRPLPPRPTSLKSTPSFNTKLAADLVFMHDQEGGKFHYLHIVDPAGGFNVFALLKTREPLEVLDKFTDCWASWAGYPQSMRLDRDGAFEGEFWEKLTSAGVELEYVPAEAHWQAGDVEAYNRAFQTVASKLIDEHNLVGELDMKMLGVTVGAALNSKVRMSGASPNQWVFGKDPAVPGDLLNMDGTIEAQQGLQQDQELRRRAQVRAKADAYLSEYRIDEALRRAVSRQGRPPRQRYESGELVAFWRNVKRRKGKLVQPGWFRGTVIGPHKGSEEGQQSNYWVSSNGRCILVSMEQLRPAFGTELWPVQEDDLQHIEDNMPDVYYDERGDPPLATDFADAPEESIVIPHYDSEPVAAGTDAAAASSSQAPSDVTQLSPTASRAPGTPIGSLFPPRNPRRSAGESEDMPDVKRARHDATSDVDILSDVGEAAATEEMREARPPHESLATPTEQINAVLEATLHRDKWRLTSDSNWLIRQHRKPRRRLFSPHEAPSAPVAMENISKQRHTVVYYTSTYEQDFPYGITDTWDDDLEQDDVGKEWTGETWFRLSHVTRKEAKALEKEIPFNLIPDEEREAYSAALSKEWGTWMKYGAVKALSIEASQEVERQVDKRRILDTRVCYRNKNAAYPWMPPKHKAPHRMPWRP